MAADLFADAELRLDPEALLEAVAKQVASSLHLAAAAGAGAMKVLASYYTRVAPHVTVTARAGSGRGRAQVMPFCVALARSTVLYHLQMNKPNLQDVELWAQVLDEAISAISLEFSRSDHHRHGDEDEAVLGHPLISSVLRCGILGLSDEQSRTDRRRLSGVESPAHAIVLLPSGQFAAFSHLVVNLSRSGSVPEPLFAEWASLLATRYTLVRSPLVAYRAEQLVVRCVDSIPPEEHRSALHAAVSHGASVVPLEQLRVLFFRLEACISGHAHTASTEDLALIVVSASVFLRYTSPVRRSFVETYLYPALCNPNLAPFLADANARLHLCDLLMRLIGPSTSSRCPFYLCLCSLLQSFLADATSAAQVLTTLASRTMPHAAHFAAALAADRNMDAECFTNTTLRLSRGLAFALGQLEGLAEDPIGGMIDNNAGLAYRIVVMLRSIVRKVATQPTANARAARMLVGLRAAMPSSSLAAIGQFAEQAFTVSNEADADPATPTLLIAEIDMVLHGTNLESALSSVHAFFGESMEVCTFCNKTRAAEEQCTLNGAEHLANCQAKQRLARTVAEECGGTETVSHVACELLRSAPLSPATHRTVFELLRESAAHQPQLLQAIDLPLEHVLSELHGLVARPDSSCFSDVVTAAQVTSGLIFVTRTVAALSCTYSAASPIAEGVMRKFQLLIRSLLSVFSEEHRRSMAELGAESALVHHVAMTVWWCCGWLLRRSHSRCVQLKPTPNAASAADTKNGSSDSAKSDIVAAANALALLSALNSVHHVSWFTERLVGLTVSRLVADFNMQVANIVEHLFAPHGIQRPDLTTIDRFALPTSTDSELWRFVKHQLRRSAPFRVAFSASVAQSTALRFRGHARDPSAALHAHGAQSEPVAPVFFTCVVEAMRQDGTLARHVVDSMISGMRGHSSTGKGNAVNRDLASSPSRRLLFAHALQQLVANLQMFTGVADSESPHSGVVSQPASNVKPALELAAQALTSEAVALQSLASTFAGGARSPLARLMIRVSDQCAARVPPAHEVPPPPPDFSPFAGVPPPDFTDGAAVHRLGPGLARSTSAGSVSSVVLNTFPTGDIQSRASAVASHMASSGGQIIDTALFDRIVELSQSHAPRSERFDSRSASALGSVAGQSDHTVGDFGAFDFPDDTSSRRASLDRAPHQHFPAPSDSVALGVSDNGSARSGALPTSNTQTRVPRPGPLPPATSSRNPQAMSESKAVQVDTGVDAAAQTTGAADSAPKPPFVRAPAVVQVTGRAVAEAVASAAAVATSMSQDSTSDESAANDDEGLTQIHDWVSRQRMQSVLRELSFLRGVREEEELAMSDHALQSRAAANADFDKPRMREGSRHRNGQPDLSGALPADKPTDVKSHSAYSAAAVDWAEWQGNQGGQVRLTTFETEGLPRDSSAWEAGASRPRTFGASVSGNPQSKARSQTTYTAGFHSNSRQAPSRPLDTSFGNNDMW